MPEPGGQDDRRDREPTDAVPPAPDPESLGYLHLRALPDRRADPTLPHEEPAHRRRRIPISEGIEFLPQDRRRDSRAEGIQFLTPGGVADSRQAESGRPDANRKASDPEGVRFLLGRSTDEPERSRPKGGKRLRFKIQHIMYLTMWSALLLSVRDRLIESLGVFLTALLWASGIVAAALTIGVYAIAFLMEEGENKDKLVRRILYILCADLLVPTIIFLPEWASVFFSIRLPAFPSRPELLRATAWFLGIVGGAMTASVFGIALMMEDSPRRDWLVRRILMALCADLFLLLILALLPIFA